MPAAPKTYNKAGTAFDESPNGVPAMETDAYKSKYGSLDENDALQMVENDLRSVEVEHAMLLQARRSLRKTGASDFIFPKTITVANIMTKPVKDRDDIIAVYVDGRKVGEYFVAKQTFRYRMSRQTGGALDKLSSYLWIKEDIVSLEDAISTLVDQWNDRDWQRRKQDAKAESEGEAGEADTDGEDDGDDEMDDDSEDDGSDL